MINHIEIKQSPGALNEACYNYKVSKKIKQKPTAGYTHKEYIHKLITERAHAQAIRARTHGRDTWKNPWRIASPSDKIRVRAIAAA
jgi:hypothetical protein